MPLILPARTLDDSYEISNSVRFNTGDSPKLQRTTGSTGTSRRKFTLSVWLKICQDASAGMTIFSWNDGGHRTVCKIDDSSEQISMFLSDSQSYELKTNQSFRDYNAWFHLCINMDSEQSTSSDRAAIYINGTKVTSLATANYPAEDWDSPINSNTENTIGRDVNHDNKPYDGYMAELFHIDGTAYAPTNFGEFNDNGVWIPKDAKGDLTFGTHGYYMEFKQTGTGTNSSGIGADTSGNGNHYAVTNLTAEDITTDTPTNNFATINALANYYNPATLSEGNTRVDFANDVSTSYVISTIGVASGKWYCEVKGVDIPSYGEIGIASRPRQDDGNDDKLTVNVNNYGYTANNGNVKSNGTAGSSYGNSYSDGDMIGIAMDLDNNKLYFSKNGTWQNSGDPTSGSTGTGAFSIAEATTTHDGFYYFAGGSNINNDNTRMDFNFGNPSFSISSGNADANGYGNFEYAVPSGYYALCTKNLAEYG